MNRTARDAAVAAVLVSLSPRSRRKPCTIVRRQLAFRAWVAPGTPTPSLAPPVSTPMSPVSVIAGGGNFTLTINALSTAAKCHQCITP